MTNADRREQCLELLRVDDLVRRLHGVEATLRGLRVPVLVVATQNEIRAQLRHFWHLARALEIGGPRTPDNQAHACAVAREMLELLDEIAA